MPRTSEALSTKGLWSGRRDLNPPRPHRTVRQHSAPALTATIEGGLALEGNEGIDRLIEAALQ